MIFKECKGLQYLSSLGDLVGDRCGDRLGDPGVTGGEARGDTPAPDIGDASPDPRDIPHSEEPCGESELNILTITQKVPS